MSTEMWVGYRMSVRIQAGQSVHTWVKSKVEAGGGLQIGPFRLGGSGSRETEAKFDFRQATEITAQGLADWPYVVCMTSLATVPSEVLNRRTVDTYALAKKTRSKRLKLAS